MINLLLVDDELLVRTNLKLLLKNFEDEISICGEASNGEEALAIIPDCKPDVIISDMQMSPINGLQLCQNVNELYPEISFIALSNYDDFDYVRGSLRNGASDYLLKHTINSDKLTETIFKSASEHNKSNYEKSSASLSTLRTKFICDLVDGGILSDDIFSYSLRALSLHLHPLSIYPIAMQLDNYSTICSYDSKRKHVIDFSVLNIGNEVIENHSDGVLGKIGENNYVILLSFFNTNSQAEVENKIHHIIQMLQSNYKKYLNIQTSFAIGLVAKHYSEIPEKYRLAKQLLQDSTYSTTQSINRVNSQYSNTTASKGLDKVTERKIELTIESQNIEKVLDIINTAFENSSQNSSIVKNIFLDINRLIQNYCKKNDLDINKYYRNRDFAHFIELNPSIDEINRFFKEVLEPLCTIEYENKDLSSYTRDAIKYIHYHYGEHISQQTAADYIQISAGYLSTLFKTELGEGFSEYLSNYRKSIAQKMIISGNSDYKAIASQCGFSDYSYFFKVFKKKTNLTPSEYKSGI